MENVAYHKESWINNKRQFKRHVRTNWLHGQAGRAVDGNFDQALHSCTVLDNFYVDKPIWMVDLGVKRKIAGLIIYTWQGKDGGKCLYMANPLCYVHITQITLDRANN